MITVLFRAKIRAGKEDEAIAAIKAMVAEVKKNENGAIAYIAHRLQDDPSEVVYYEAYKDDAAFKTHMETPHMAAMRASFGELFDTTAVKVERMDEIAGVLREN